MGKVKSALRNSVSEDIKRMVVPENELSGKTTRVGRIPTKNFLKFLTEKALGYGDSVLKKITK